MEKTASQTLIDVMERFGEQEPKSIVVMWMDEACGIHNVNTIEALGYLSLAQSAIAKNMFVEPER